MNSEIQQKQKYCIACANVLECAYNWNSYVLLTCSNCSLETVELLPHPEALEQFYQGISAKKFVDWNKCKARIEKAFEKYLAPLVDLPEKSFLDVGGGAGYYAQAAQVHGYSARLIDFAHDALEFAQNKLKVTQVTHGNIQYCANFLGGKQYGLVLSRHTIEHMLDPQKFVEQLALVTQPKGYLYLETPNVSSFEQLAHPRQIMFNYQILKNRILKCLRLS